MKTKLILWAVLLGLLFTALSAFISIMHDEIYLAAFNSYSVSIPNPGNLVALSNYSGFPLPYLFAASMETLDFGPLAFIFDFVIFFVIVFVVESLIENTKEKNKESKRIKKQELRYGRRKIKRR